MQTIFVSPDFPLNRRMRKDIRRGKLQVVREGGKLLTTGREIPSGLGRGLPAYSSPLVCMAEGGGTVGGGGPYTESEFGEKVFVSQFIQKVYNAVSCFAKEDDSGEGWRADFLVWRGVSQDYPLVPSAYRETGKTGNLGDKKHWERTLAQEYKKRVAARQSGLPNDAEHLKWLCHMQHNGLPTKLLDWSESPLVALYFAVQKKEETPKDGIVWGLHFGHLNKFQGGSFGIVGQDNEVIKRMAKEPFADSTVKNPSKQVFCIGTLQMEMQHLLQQSWFTIHGDDTPLEKLHGDGEKRCLVRIRIPKEQKENIRQTLDILGVREHHLFAGPEHLAKHLKEASYRLG